MRWRNTTDCYRGIYAVSEYGDIKVIASNGRNRKNGLILKPYFNNKGYLCVCLSVDDKRRHFKIHRLVARAFIGKCPDGHQVNHIDGIKKNNHYTNLEYVTNKENMRHACKMGLRAPQKCESNHNSKLTKENVIWIRKKFNVPPYYYEDLLEVAKKFKVGFGTIQSVAYGYTWKYLQ